MFLKNMSIKNRVAAGLSKWLPTLMMASLWIKNEIKSLTLSSSLPNNRVKKAMQIMINDMIKSK